MHNGVFLEDADMLALSRPDFTELGSLLDSFSPTMRHRSDSVRMDVVVVDEGTKLVFEVPGIAKEDISVEVDKGYLVIKGEKKNINGTLTHSEISYGKFERYVRLHRDVDDDDISAEYENGVLEILVKTPEQQKPKLIDIK